MSGKLLRQSYSLLTCDAHNCQEPSRASWFNGGTANFFAPAQRNPSHWVERRPLERADGVCENQEHG